MTTKEKEIKQAARDFEELYAEELKNGQVTGDTIFEWLKISIDQYPSLTVEEDCESIEEEIQG